MPSFESFLTGGKIGLGSIMLTACFFGGCRVSVAESAPFFRRIPKYHNTKQTNERQVECYTEQFVIFSGPVQKLTGFKIIWRVKTCRSGDISLVRY